MPAQGLSFPLGPGAVGLRSDGTIEGVWANPGAATSYLDGGGRVAATAREIKRGGTTPLGPTENEVGAEMRWSVATVDADVDEVEFRYLGREDLGLTVRHSFTGGWTVRVTFVNRTLQPLAVAAELAWVPAATSPARALAAGATGAYAIPGPDGTGALLGGELVLGTCDAISAEGIGLGRFTLGPLGRQVAQWRWDWFDGPASFGRGRVGAVPRDLVLPAGEAAFIAADDDQAVVVAGGRGGVVPPGISRAPGVDLNRRGGHLEFSSAGPQQVRVEVSSGRGVTAYGMEWAAPLDEVLTTIGEPLLTGPRTRAGLVRLDDVDAALVVQHLLRLGAAGSPDDADDALTLFGSRLAPDAVTDGRGAAFLCGEFERLGESDLLERATAALRRLGEPVPGLGLAAAQICVARLSLGWPVEPVVTHLAAVTAVSEPGDDLGSVAVALELRLVGAPRATRAEAEAVEAWSTRIGVGLGAGLSGRSLRPRSVDEQAYLATVLGLLPEPLASRVRPDWGCGPDDVARRVRAEVLARLNDQPPRAAHSWLIMGARLA